MPANASLDTERQGFLAGRLNVGGVWYYRDHDISEIKGLTQEDIDVYRRRGLINAHRVDENRPVRGSNLGGLVASKPVGPLTTGDVPGPASAPAPAPAPAPASAADSTTADEAVEQSNEQASEAARLMAERAERAARAIGAGKGGKRG